MLKQDMVFVTMMDSLHLAFAGDSQETLEKLIDEIPKKYARSQLSVDHYIALMNCGRTYLRILKEG